MTVLFFNMPGPFAVVANSVFRALGASDASEGDSANALGGVYYASRILGVKLRLERNSYDHEDDYEYTMFLRRDPVTDLALSPEVLEQLTPIVAAVLSVNADVDVGVESDHGFEVYRSGKCLPSST